MHLTNDFIRKLIGGQMWWDDDRKATGFGIRAYPGGSKSFPSIIGSTVASGGSPSDDSRVGPLQQPGKKQRNYAKGSIEATIRQARSASAEMRQRFKI